MTGRGVASAAVVVTAFALAPAGFLAVAPAFAALGLVPLAIRWRSRPTALVATTVLLGGVVAAGMLDLPAGLLVVATVGTVLTWDATSQTIGLHEQLDDDADTRRALLAHVGATLAATALVGSMAYLVSLLVTTTPPVAIVLFLGGAVLLVLGLEPRETISSSSR